MRWTTPACATAVVLGLSGGHPATAPAQVGSAVLWACHGPAGEPLGDGVLRSSASVDGAATTYGDGCDATASSLDDGGLRASFARADPAGGSTASWRLEVSPEVTLRSVRLLRRTAGFGGPAVPGNPLRYVASAGQAELESARLDDASNVALSGSFAADVAGGDRVQAQVDCGLAAALRCAAPSAGTVAVEVGTIAVGVTDADPPRGGVGGLSDPASGTIRLALFATDVGLGLASARVQLDDRVVATAALGGADCHDLTPGDPRTDLAAGAACPRSVTNVPLVVDTTVVADGRHRLEVLVGDAAGNVAAVVSRTIDLHNAPPVYSPTARLTVGTTSAAPLAGPAGGVAAATTAAGPARCRRPKLSMVLTQEWGHTRSGVPILRHHHRYRFRGSLTCALAGRRVSAPRHVPIDILNIVGGRILVKSGTSTRRSGRITAILSYPSSRTVVFRHRSVDDSVARVKIRVIVRRRSPTRPRR